MRFYDIASGFAEETAELAEGPGQRRGVPGVLAGITVFALAAAAWDIGHRETHYYYSAAVRSMSDSWHGFFYGALDPSAFVTVDKIPGALWVQALSVRLFGFHGWAMALPEVLAFAATVVLLFRVVRSWAGADAGLIAAATYATTPVVGVLARTTIPDTLLVFFLVFSAERFWVALEKGRRRDIVLSGVLIGVAFNMKMLQALLVVPILVLVYGVWGPRPARKRIADLLLAGGALVVVASAWIVLVQLTPASGRPYVGGTTHNSAVELVVRYDGLDRFRSAEQHLPFGGLAGPTRLFNHELAPQIAWLLPLALLGLLVGLRRSRLKGPLGAGYAFWGLWLGIHALAFSGASYGIHPYYTVALAPAIAALAGAALVGSPRRGLLAVYLAVGCACAWFVTERADYLLWAPALATLVALVAFLAVSYRPASGARYLAVVSLLVVPTIWAIDSLRQQQTFWGAINPVAGLRAGGIDAPDPIAPVGDLRPLAAYLRAHSGSRYAAAATDALTASPLISTFNLRILPLGGLSGSDPPPTPAVLQRLIRSDAVRLVVSRPPAASPYAIARNSWLSQHCRVQRVPRFLALREMHAQLLDCG
jgi:4-amino-4-deoxy-L-arabinose transferase-like glycosyltransferase